MAVPPNETILETIERRLVPDEQAKKARGEVFTPLNLVRELLYGLRKSDLEKGEQLIWGIDKNHVMIDDNPDDHIGGIPLEIWRDPDTKLLDPANGIGNFPFVAFEILDYQLRNHGIKGSNKWNSKKRRKHIIEKMLYMIEIDQGNVNTARKVMNFLCKEAKPNICCADTLKFTDEDLMKQFGVNRFNVIMGNPPFNMPRELKGQTGTLWDKFISYSLNLLSKNGYLAFINPANWRRPESKLYDDMVQKHQLIFLHIIGKRQGQKLFGATTRIDMYLLQMSPRVKNTIILDEQDKLITLDTHRFPFLPNYAFDKIQSILVPESDGIQVIFSSSIYEHRKKYVKKEMDAEYKYPIAHSMTQKGIGFLYTNDNTKGHFGVPKVLLNVNEQQYPFNDYAGKYGMSQLTFGIPIKSKEEGDQIVAAINTEEFKEIIKATKWGAFQTDYRMFKHFRPDFYKEFLPK